MSVRARAAGREGRKGNGLRMEGGTRGAGVARWEWHAALKCGCCVCWEGPIARRVHRRRVTRQQPNTGLQKDGLALKDVDGFVRHFAVKAERHAQLENLSTTPATH